MRQTDVAPFASETVAAFVYDAIDHHAATDPGPQDHPEDHPMSGGGAVRGFRERKTVGIVGGANRKSNRDVQI